MMDEARPWNAQMTSDRVLRRGQLTGAQQGTKALHCQLLKALRLAGLPSAVEHPKPHVSL